MELKISTPSKVMYHGPIEKISIPTENGNLKVMSGHAPMVTSVKPGLIKVRPMKNHIQVGDEMLVSTAKGMVFIDGKIVRIMSTDATLSPEETESVLQQNKRSLEQKIKRLKNE